MATRRVVAARLAYGAGFLLLVSNTSGGAVLERLLLDVLAAHLPPAGARPLAALGVILAALAGLGGFTVIAGGWVVEHRSRRLGAFLIALGTGLGVPGLVANVVFLILDGGDLLGYALGFATGVAGLAVVLSFVAQVYAAPLPVRKVWRRVRRRAP